MSIFKKVIVATVFAFVLLFAILWVILSSSSNKIFIESDAFRTSVEYIYSDSITQNRIGQIVKVDSSVSGYLTLNESARLVFDVYTSRQQDVTVKCRLKYENDQWIIEEVEYD